MHTASVAIDCPSPADAQLLVAAVAVEEGPDNTETKLVPDGATVRVELTAPDVSTLRAALHSVLRLLDAAQRTLAIRGSSGKD